MERRKPMNMLWKAGRLGSALLLVAVLTGCATGPRFVRTEVTRFNAWDTLPVERSYRFARTLEFQDSLELQGYEALVRDELALQGFVLAVAPAQANLTVTLRPSVSGTAVRVPDFWPVGPYWGGFDGYYGPGRFGYGYGPFGSLGSPSPILDGFNSRIVEIFKRRLELDIDSRTMPGRRYFEGRVESTGEDDSLPHAMPILIRALFTDFPGGNGETRPVDVPVERRR